jgi:hypothetical protein
MTQPAPMSRREPIKIDALKSQALACMRRWWLTELCGSNRNPNWIKDTQVLGTGVIETNLEGSLPYKRS